MSTRRARFATALHRPLLALLGLLLALSGLALGAAPAAADEPVALATISLTSLTPTLPQRDGTVTMRGRVTNTSQERLFRLQAIFWRNQAPITGSEGLDQTLGSLSNVPLGLRYTPVYQNLFTEVAPYLEPGASASFTLTANVADLALSPSDGVYLMGVHVLQNGNPVAVARTRVLVPVLSGEPAGKVSTTTLVVLSSRPSQIAPGLLSDEHLADEVGPRGRLTKLLDAAEDDDTSFAVDPALVDELQTMRTGYQVRTGEGGRTSGRGQSDATRWLADFNRVRAEHDGYRTLYGSPDVAALVHAGLRDVLDAAAAAGRTVTDTADLPLVVLPTNGAADKETVQAVEELDPRAIVLSNASTGGLGSLLNGPGDAPVVTYAATGQGGGGPGPDPSDDAVHVTQRTLAASWIEASGGSSTGTNGQVRVIRRAAEATSTDAGSDAPWVESETLADLLERTPKTWNEAYDYPAAAAASELSAGQLDGVRRLADSEQTWRDLLAVPGTAESEGQTAVARAASGAWRGQNAARNTWLRPQQATLDDRLLTKIRISSTNRVSTVAREGVEFPITVRNDLAFDESAADTNAVKVRIGFVSDNADRLSIADIDTPAIRAQDGYTDNAVVKARANGIVPVTAQLYTQSGRKVGRPVVIQVQVTQNGTTGWAIAIAAGVVLIGSTSFRIRQVARERARNAEAGEAGSPPPEPVSALTSAPASDAAPGRHDDPSSTVSG